MKLRRKTLHAQRRTLDAKLKKWMKLAAHDRPRCGWIRAIRESLGMSSLQLAKRLGLSSPANVLRLEEREAHSNVTLAMLEKAARAMGCRVVYAVIPAEGNARSLEELLQSQARKVAEKYTLDVAHTMRLEQQGSSESVTKQQMKDLQKELIERLDPKLWELDNDSTRISARRHAD